MDGSFCLQPEVIGDDSLDCWRRIGGGGFGNIYRAKHEKWGINVAIKSLIGNDGATLQKEANLMFQGRNPNVLRIFGFYNGHLGNPQSYSQLGLVMEFMERGSLADLLQTLRGPPPWPLTFRITHQIGLGMNFLHQRTPPLLHLDLKPSNVLLDDSLNAKLTDFGLSRLARSMSKSVKEKDEVEGGTLSYMPPEALKSGTYMPDSAFDIYSYGVLLCSILTGQEPYGPFPTSLIRFRIRSGDRPNLSLIDVSQAEGLPEIVNLIKDCWAEEPNQRPSFRVCVDVTERLYERYKREVCDSVSDVLKQLDGDLCSGLTSMQITPKPHDEACSRGLAVNTGAFPKQETAVNNSRKKKREPVPHLTSGRGATPQRQTSTPDGMHIYMANGEFIQIGQGNTMNIIQKQRRRNKTAPSSVDRTYSHPGNIPKPL